MGVPPTPPPGPKPKSAWVAAFATRLCLIAWGTAVLTEVLPPSGFESLCILVGSQASLLGVLTCLLVWLRYRHGVFLLLLVATSVPAAYFTLVVQQIARQKGWIH